LHAPLSLSFSSWSPHQCPGVLRFCSFLPLLLFFFRCGPPCTFSFHFTHDPKMVWLLLIFLPPPLPLVQTLGLPSLLFAFSSWRASRFFFPTLVDPQMVSVYSVSLDAVPAFSGGTAPSLPHHQPMGSEWSRFFFFVSGPFFPQRVDLGFIRPNSFFSCHPTFSSFHSPCPFCKKMSICSPPPDNHFLSPSPCGCLVSKPGTRFVLSLGFLASIPLPRFRAAKFSFPHSVPPQYIHPISQLRVLVTLPRS